MNSEQICQILLKKYRNKSGGFDTDDFRDDVDYRLTEYYHFESKVKNGKSVKEIALEITRDEIENCVFSKDAFFKSVVSLNEAVNILNMLCEDARQEYWVKVEDNIQAGIYELGLY